MLAVLALIDVVLISNLLVMVVIGGYVVAMSPPIAAALRRLAAVPSTGRGAGVFVGVLVAVAVGVAPDLSRLTDDELETLRALREKL